MHHIHLPQTSSTQTDLKNFLLNKKNHPLLVSTSHQTKGKGRQGNDWEFFDGSLAFSFTLIPHNIISLTPLEIGVQLVNFFQIFYNQKVFLKWPNDLLNENGDKIGGIICENNGKDFILAGIGINIGIDTVHLQDQKKASGLKFSLTPNHQNEIPRLFYNYIGNNRKSRDEIIKLWTQNCFHMNKKVSLQNNKTEEGIFKGIGINGEAILLIDNIEKKFYSGSLFIQSV